MKKPLFLLAVSAIAVAAIAAAVVAGPATAGSVATAASTKAVKVGDDYFVKSGKVSTLSIAKNTTLKFSWTGKQPHNVTVTSGPQKFRSGTKTKGATYSVKVAKAGSYKIVCTIHPGMDLNLKVK